MRIIIDRCRVSKTEILPLIIVDRCSKKNSSSTGPDYPQLAIVRGFFKNGHYGIESENVV